MKNDEGTLLLGGGSSLFFSILLVLLAANLTPTLSPLMLSTLLVENEATNNVAVSGEKSWCKKLKIQKL